MNGIHLIPLAPDTELAIEEFAEDLRSVLFAPVSVLRLPLRIEDAYDASRRQYHSGRILGMLLDHAPAGAGKLLGITGHDIFLPVLTFVFGQAQLANRAALFSSYRLRNEFYGLPHSRLDLRSRAFKEALHELGHTFGLRHCMDTPCVMNASTYVEDIDLKPAEYCNSCRDIVDAALRAEE